MKYTAGNFHRIIMKMEKNVSKSELVKLSAVRFVTSGSAMMNCLLTIVEKILILEAACIQSLKL